MHKFTIYDSTTGNVLRSGGVTNLADVPRQVGPGESILTDVVGTPGRDRVVDGALQPVAASLVERKAAAKSRLAERRWRAEVGGMTFNGVTLMTDDRSKTLIAGAASYAAQNPSFTTIWKAKGGVWLTLDAATIIAAHNAILNHVRTCFAREAVLVQAIDAASDEAALAEIEAAIEPFWP